ncbi:MAG: hypothetical protein M1819_005361 [Sarea resinae]|nr:MAG: hypothetical protein M1819_005361 [Sarea resinae]
MATEAFAGNKGLKHYEELASDPEGNCFAYYMQVHPKHMLEELDLSRVESRPSKTLKARSEARNAKTSRKSSKKGDILSSPPTDSRLERRSKAQRRASPVLGTGKKGSNNGVAKRK